MAGDMPPSWPADAQVVGTLEPLPKVPYVYLAGPTDRSVPFGEWRFRAITALRLAGYMGPIVVPQLRGGFKSGMGDKILPWETAAMKGAKVIFFALVWADQGAPGNGRTTAAELGEWTTLVKHNLTTTRLVVYLPPAAPSGSWPREHVAPADLFGTWDAATAEAARRMKR